MSIPSRLLTPSLAALALAMGCPASTPEYEFSWQQHQLLFPIGPGENHEMGKPVEGSPRTETITCEGCHGGGDQFAQYYCLNCHGVTTGTLESGHALVPQFEREVEACYRCHARGQRGVEIEIPPEQGVDAGPAPETPAHAFPVGDGTAHGPDNEGYMAAVEGQGKTHCNACHASTADLSQTLCAECHNAGDPTAESLHTGIAAGGYNAVSDCKQCHWTTPLPNMLHMSSHDNASCTSHFGAQCMGCHDAEARQGQPYSWGIDSDMGGEPVECAPCHAGDPRNYPQPCN